MPDMESIEFLLHEFQTQGTVAPKPLDKLSNASGVSGWNVLFPREEAADPRQVWLRRLALFKQCREILALPQVRAAGKSITVNVSSSALFLHWLPLADWALQCARENEKRRWLLGVAGPPGSGKTVFCEILKLVLNTLDAGEKGICEVVGMDGFHYPNAFLDSHDVADSCGQRVCLRKLKGLPPTFDLDSFLKTLEKLRHGSVEVLVPAYDRNLHEPVQNALRIGTHQRLALVEGNFLLDTEGRWKEVRSLLNHCIYLEVGRSICRERLICRHVGGGKTLEEADAHYRRVDKPNHDRVTRSSVRADLIVYLSKDGCILAIRKAGHVEAG